MKMVESQDRVRGTPVIRLDHSFDLNRQLIFKKCNVFDDDSSLDSSVASGIRNSLHSSYHFSDLEEGAYEDDYEGYDSFEENEEEYSWRSDPKTNGSDWTLIIKSDDDNKSSEESTTYHVHKRILTQGMKRSEYFVSMFGLNMKQHEQEESSNGTGSTTIILHEDAIMAVPDMLDYLYSCDDILKVGTETAVALLHLSQFFGIRALASEVLSFIYEDISLETMQIYLEMGATFEDVQTLNLCATICAEDIIDINPSTASSSLLKEMDASFFLDILSSLQKTNKILEHSTHMSTLLVEYCKLHKDNLEKSAFLELSDEEYLPIISQDAAIPLLQLEADLVPESTNQSEPLTSLQKRCMVAMSSTNMNGPTMTSTTTNETETTTTTTTGQPFMQIPRNTLIKMYQAFKKTDNKKSDRCESVAVTCSNNIAVR